MNQSGEIDKKDFELAIEVSLGIIFKTINFVKVYLQITPQKMGRIIIRLRLIKDKKNAVLLFLSFRLKELTKLLTSLVTMLFL